MLNIVLKIMFMRYNRFVGVSWNMLKFDNPDLDNQYCIVKMEHQKGSFAAGLVGLGLQHTIMYHFDDDRLFAVVTRTNIRYFNGKQLHRVSGPAVDSIFCKEWWLDGKLHRMDGPAIERALGTKEWWYNGVQYDEEAYNAYIQRVKNNEAYKTEKYNQTVLEVLRLNKLKKMKKDGKF
jgi:hypothetical protein